MDMRMWQIGRVPVSQEGRVETTQIMQFNPRTTTLYETHTYRRDLDSSGSQRNASSLRTTGTKA